jgi:2-dehydro-3-deoxy-D-arabinonate dehydratase
MKLYRIEESVLLEYDGQFYPINGLSWEQVVNRDDLYDWLVSQIEEIAPVRFNSDQPIPGLLPPVSGEQEIWASGVTYYRSKEARMEESEKAGGGSFYDRVYDAERPELFFKSVARRAVGHGAKVRIRRDSEWNVPEPELTLFATSSGKLVGYTIGNDMSSRSIEGENPLYLPQAKSYEGSTAIGPCLYVPREPLPEDTTIHIGIFREGEEVFAGEVTVSQMKRKPGELLQFLFRELEFPQGVYLMTGTGIIPPSEFTLQSGDVIHITIQHIGVLSNVVA